MTAPLRTSGQLLNRDDLPVNAPRAVYIGPPERRLLAWIHTPATAERDCAVVLCAPFGQESTGVYRGFRYWASGLAAAGFPTVRFDYHGTGDSAGGFDDPGCVRAWVASVGDAIAFARANSGAKHVAVAGAGVGATLALAAAVERGDVDALLLWAAFPTGRAYLREGRAFTQLMAPGGNEALAEGCEQIGGFVLTGETVANLTALDPLAGGVKLCTQTFVVPRDEGTRDNIFLERLKGVGATVEREVIAGYSDMLLDAHQALVPHAVIDRSATWLSEHFALRSFSEQRGLRVSGDDRRLALPSHAPDVDTVVESPIYFGDEGRLFGIVTRPNDGERRKTGILLTNSGSVARVGPNRLYVTLAREWAALGYTVLRMDLGGIGDSYAPADEQENHPYPKFGSSDIEEGVAALRASGVDRVVIGGLCSGAHASFHAGLSIERIDGLIMINPIVFYWKPTDSLDVLSWMNYVETRHYQVSARQWKSWARLLSGKVDVSYVARIGVTRAQEIIRAKRASIVRRFRDDSHAPEHATRDLERLASQGTDVLLIFSTGEPGLDFLRVNYRRELKRLEKHPAFTLLELEKANHTFTALGSRRRAATLMTEHLLARHP
ncbi:MAG TPA: alpha/beta hydrolase [Gemmatimonadaceae bacterium]|jgi:pimeloyl-ACP methyl ester carboxylesterase